MIQKTKIASIEDIKRELLAIDFELWMERTKIIPARERIQKLLGAKVRVVDFKKAREHCRWWKKLTKKKPSHSHCLNFDEWERLRAAVKSVLHEIQGRTLNEAVAIVSSITGVPCNRSTLEGLNSDLRVWKKPTKKELQ